MRTRTRRFLKLTIGAELRRQLVTSVKVRRGPRNDTIDFPPVVRKAHSVVPIGMGIGDRGYDSERNHRILREELHAMSIIPPHMEGVPLWRTYGVYRKEMKRRFSETVYHQRAKDETIFSVVKRTMGDEMRSVRAKGLGRERGDRREGLPEEEPRLPRTKDEPDRTEQEGPQEPHEEEGVFLFITNDDSRSDPFDLLDQYRMRGEHERCLGCLSALGVKHLPARNQERR